MQEFDTTYLEKRQVHLVPMFGYVFKVFNVQQCVSWIIESSYYHKRVLLREKVDVSEKETIL